MVPSLVPILVLFERKVSNLEFTIRAFKLAQKASLNINVTGLVDICMTIITMLVLCKRKSKKLNYTKMKRNRGENTCTYIISVDVQNPVPV